MNGANTNIPQKPYIMLGIAARISMRKLKGERIEEGAISERKTATPMLTGSDSRRASIEETTVPNIKGSAPNCSVTGFQSEEKMKPNPNISLLSEESLYISRAMNMTNADTISANISVIFSKIMSPAFFLLLISL